MIYSGWKERIPIVQSVVIWTHKSGYGVGYVSYRGLLTYSRTPEAYERCSRTARCQLRIHIYITYIIHTNIHKTYTYIQQLFSQVYNLASHITHVVCVNFIRDWRDLQFNVDSERKTFFEKLFHGNFIILLEFLPEIFGEEIAEVIFFSYFSLMPDLGFEPEPTY